MTLEEIIKKEGFKKVSKENIPRDKKEVLCIVEIKRIPILGNTPIISYEYHVGSMMEDSNKNNFWIVGNRFEWDLGKVLAWKELTPIEY